MQLIDIFDARRRVQFSKIWGKQFIKGENQKPMARKRTSENEIAVSQGAAAVPARRKTAAPHKMHTPATSVVEPASEPVTAPVAPVAQPTHEEIAALAYSYWEGRGYQGGTPEEDWLRAEAELRAAQPVTA
jgi:hypothetical protein